MDFAKERIRILHLVSTLNIGGLEMVVLNLAQQADRDRFELHVLCVGETGALAPRFQELAITADGLDHDRPSYGRTVPALFRRLRALRPHVLHTHNPSPHIYGAWAALLARVPALVHTKHGRNYPDQRRSVFLNRVASALTDRVVPVSEDAAVVVREVERVPASKVLVIRNGIDLEAFPLAPADRPFRKRAIHVARLNRIKDQATLLRAVRRVADVEPDFRLDIVGDGECRDELAVLRRQLGLECVVRFLGYRADVCELLAEADFFVLSSISEGISLTLLEAMAVGLPVAATDVGGNREVVVPGETGFLVPAREPDALGKAMLQLVRDPAQTRRFGQASRHRVEREFDLKRVVRRYEDLYLELLASKT